jgi:acyl-CoA thioesterase YciA
MIENIPPSLERLMLRSIAMPAQTNPSGNIFGGWLLSQMDLAGANAGTRRCGGPVVTVAIESIVFHEPVNVGDEVSSYAEVIHVGRTSLKVQVDVWIRSNRVGQPRRVAEGRFVFVAIDDKKRPRPIEKIDG